MFHSYNMLQKNETRIQEIETILRQTIVCYVLFVKHEQEFLSDVERKATAGCFISDKAQIASAFWPKDDQGFV